MTGIGHNSTDTSGIKSLVARIERLEADKKTLQADIKEVYAEAKTSGFNTKALRAAIKWRAQDYTKREEQQAMLDVYLEALGDLASTPLGKSALEHASA